MQLSIYTSEGLLTFLLTMGGNEDFFFMLNWSCEYNVRSSWLPFWYCKGIVNLRREPRKESKAHRMTNGL